jgi:hypothetical protein
MQQYVERWEMFKCVTNVYENDVRNILQLGFLSSPFQCECNSLWKPRNGATAEVK